MSNTANTVRWTAADLELLSTDEWKRYEIIDGELFMTRAPNLGHQDAIGQLYARLLFWSEETGLGKPFFNPGLVFSDTDNVIPDLVWVSRERLTTIVDEDGHLTAAPELVIEVLSAGSSNERRDREVKLKLYSVKGVQEYWIVDWRSASLVGFAQSRQVAVYRRENAQLQAVSTLLATDQLTSPLLPGFQCQVDRCFT